MTDADKPAFAAAFTAAAVALREKDPDVLMMDVYFHELRDLALELIVESANRLMKTAKYFPTVPDWRTAACQVASQRAEEQREALRKLPAPRCQTCDDTGWAPGDGRVRRCSCWEERRLELLGRQPPPALPPTAAPPAAPEQATGEITDTRLTGTTTKRASTGAR